MNAVHDDFMTLKLAELSLPLLCSFSDYPEMLDVVLQEAGIIAIGRRVSLVQCIQAHARDSRSEQGKRAKRRTTVRSHIDDDDDDDEPEMNRGNSSFSNTNIPSHLLMMMSAMPTNNTNRTEQWQESNSPNKSPKELTSKLSSGSLASVPEQDNEEEHVADLDQLPPHLLELQAQDSTDVARYQESPLHQANALPSPKDPPPPTPQFTPSGPDIDDNRRSSSSVSTVASTTDPFLQDGDGTDRLSS